MDTAGGPHCCGRHAAANRDRDYHRGASRAACVVALYICVCALHSHVARVTAAAPQCTTNQCNAVANITRAKKRPSLVCVRGEHRTGQTYLLSMTNVPTERACVAAMHWRRLSAVGRSVAMKHSRTCGAARRGAVRRSQLRESCGRQYKPQRAKACERGGHADEQAAAAMHVVHEAEGCGAHKHPKRRRRKSANPRDPSSRRTRACMRRAMQPTVTTAEYSSQASRTSNARALSSSPSTASGTGPASSAAARIASDSALASTTSCSAAHPLGAADGALQPLRRPNR